jgi:hypothetical protein
VISIEGTWKLGGATQPRRKREHMGTYTARLKKTSAQEAEGNRTNMNAILRLPPRGEIAFPIKKVQRDLGAKVKRIERDAIRLYPSQVKVGSATSCRPR